MTRLKPYKHWAFVWVAFPLLISLACNALSGLPRGSQPGEVTIHQDMIFGPGSFIYMDPRAGLADLSSYKATLTMTFDGTRDGQAEKWSKTYVMLATKDPQARQWNIENTGDLPNLDPVFLAEMNGTDYARRGEEACSATAIREGDLLSDRLEPATFLTGVIGAEEAGSETVNGAAANHYTFDQRALVQQGITESTGEVWVATEGGYVVKYLLNTKANADYFGEGLEGTLTLDYELTDVNKKVTLKLPVDCPPGLVDAPQLQDASNVVSSPGLLSYDTSASIADSVAFYQKGLKDQGWKSVQDPAVSESTTILTYTKTDQIMSIILAAKDGKTTVTIIIGRVQE